jgi:hypothetical protein
MGCSGRVMDKVHHRRGLINALVKLTTAAVLVVSHMPECCVTQAHMFNLPNLDAQIERFGNKLRHQQRLRAALDSLAAQRRYGGGGGRGGRFARMAPHGDDNGAADFLRGMSMLYPRQAPSPQEDLVNRGPQAPGIKVVVH